MPWFVEYEAVRADKSRPVTIPPVRHRRRAAFRVARRDARRRATLLHRGRGEALRRSARAVQDEPAAPASRGRPGLAHRDHVVAEPDDARRQHRSRRRTRRLLHAGAVRGPRRLRAVALRHDRPGDRHAGPHERGAGVVPRAELQRDRAAALHRDRASGSARSAWRRRSPTRSSTTWSARLRR